MSYSLLMTKSSLLALFDSVRGQKWSFSPICADLAMIIPSSDVMVIIMTHAEIVFN